jgi:hypothetical protein
MALLDDLRREVRQSGERIARAAAVQMQGDLRRDTPRITGQLAKQTTVRLLSGGDTITVEAVADTEYAEPVIRGARPHIIRARKEGGFLRFPDKAGVFIFRHQVNHPGNKPNLYWETHIQRWRQYLQAAADRLR